MNILIVKEKKKDGKTSINVSASQDGKSVGNWTDVTEPKYEPGPRNKGQRVVFQMGPSTIELVGQADMNIFHLNKTEAAE